MTGPTLVLELRTVLGTGGGPEKTILSGANALDPARYRTIVCYLRDVRDHVFAIDERARSANVEYIEVRERHSLDWRIWPQLRRIVRERGIRIVHAHDYKTDLLTLMLGRFEGIIPLSTVHGWVGQSWKEQRIYFPADRRLLVRYPRVITVSSDIRDSLITAGADPARVTVILNGIDEVMFARRPGTEGVARDRFGIEPGQIVVGATGRLEREKNFVLLVRAFARVAAGNPNAVLLIAGEGALRDDLGREIARLGLAGRCRLVGQISDVGVFHHALDVFVQSSDHEGTPNAILEAMALETPIVATDAGGTSELARSGREALIVPRRNEEALARAIDQALSDREAARRRTAAARLRVASELSFARRMQRIEAVYEELLAEDASRPSGRST